MGNFRIEPHKTYSNHYKEQLFLLWYSEGKPTLHSFHKIIPGDSAGDKPTLDTLKGWSHYLKWKNRGNLLDDEVKQKIEAHAIAEKVEMLSRHAKTGKELQEIGAEYIREHLDEIKPSVAVRMIVEGVKIEQGSRGIGTAFIDAVNMSDDELTTKLEDLIGKSKVEILPLEDGN